VYSFLIVVHLFICFLMVAVILLQSGKGAEIGASFGGSSQTIFGSRGPGTFLSKITVGAAVLFMLTSLSLAVASKEKSLFSVLDAQEETSLPLESGSISEDQSDEPSTDDDSPSMDIPEGEISLPSSQVPDKPEG